MLQPTTNGTLDNIRRRIAVAMRRHQLDDRDPRHVEAFLRSDPAYDTTEKLTTIKPLELERWVINAVGVLDRGGSGRIYDQRAATLEIPEFAYVDIFKSLELL